jgi:hypothetical protein
MAHRFPAVPRVRCLNIVNTPSLNSHESEIEPNLSVDDFGDSWKPVIAEAHEGESHQLGRNDTNLCYFQPDQDE